MVDVNKNVIWKKLIQSFKKYYHFHVKNCNVHTEISWNNFLLLDFLRACLLLIVESSAGGARKIMITHNTKQKLKHQFNHIFKRHWDHADGTVLSSVSHTVNIQSSCGSPVIVLRFEKKSIQNSSGKKNNWVNANFGYSLYIMTLIHEHLWCGWEKFSMCTKSPAW